ncbi:MAG TPA: DoxX family protein, partial [Actinoplanes sp.]|nr:DoxX family protein [Actinoplanes sp.]
MGVTVETGKTAVWPWVSTLARLALAAVWLIAGATKVGDLAAAGRA